MRFREFELNFKISDNLEEIKMDKMGEYRYGSMSKTLGDFQLDIEPGSFRSSQIVVMLGENGTGKTTFITMLAGASSENSDIPEMNVSYKPQKIKPTFEGSVRELLSKRFKDLWMHPQFTTDVTKPLKLEDIIDNEVKTLSGGELQRVAIILALCKPADVYLIDEPSAFLDAEQRVIVARLIKRYIINSKKAAFIVEHDFIMSSYLADLVIVYEGVPGKKCKANTPQSLVSGMNKFLGILGITFRRDPTNFRPRINKIDSILDKEQKLSGNYFSLE
jgi:ATP-binding cassette subfamily E protein 1